MGLFNGDFIELSLIGYDPRLLKSVYKCVPYLLPDARMHFGIAARAHIIVAKSRSSPVLARAASFRALEVDGLV